MMRVMKNALLALRGTDALCFDFYPIFELLLFSLHKLCFLL